MESGERSKASTPSIYTAIVESLPETLQSDHTWEQFAGDSPIQQENTGRPTRGTGTYAEVSRVRIKKESFQSIVDEESHKLDALYQEGEALKVDIVNYMEMVDRLQQKRDEAGDVWRTTLGKYNSYQKNFSTLRSAVVGIQSKWKEEAAEFNKLARRLQVLRSKRPQLEAELIGVSTECDSLSRKVSAAQAERDRLESLLSKLTRSNEKADSLLRQTSTSTQTMCDFRVMNDIEKIQKQLSAQLKTVKGVREAVELVRRCT